MPSLRETCSSVLQWGKKKGERTNPDGLGFTGVTNHIAGPLLAVPLLGLQLFVSNEIHQLSNEIDTNLGKFLVIAGLGIINAISVAAETKAVSKHKYGASSITNVLNIEINRPLASVLTSKAINYGLFAVTNPVNLYAAATGNSYLESAIAGSFVFTGWSIAINSAILSGATTPLVDRIRKTREAVGNRIKQSPQAHEVFRWLGPKR